MPARVAKILGLVLFVVWAFGPLSAAEFTPEQAGKIAQAVGKILEQRHYSQARLNDEISEIFLRNYLDALDPNHLMFLRSDVEEFRKRYAKILDEYTLEGNAQPAFAIYERYLERLRERHRLVARLLKEKFDFTKDETFTPFRSKAPWPRDEADAERLWRLRIKYELLQGRLSKQRAEETVRRIAGRYDRLLRSMRQFGSEDILQTYLTALAHAYDPHSEYMGPTLASNFEINRIKLQLTGIGAELRSEDGYVKIARLLPGGPAELSRQVRPNDRIVAVAEGDKEPVDVVDMRLSKVVELIRGPRGTVVRLTIIPGDSFDGTARKVVTLVRDEIKLTEQRARAAVVEQADGSGGSRRLGIITLAQFYNGSAEDVEKLLERLNKERVAGCLLDLRRNSGGILWEAVKLTGLFIAQGPVVQVQESGGKVRVLRDRDSKVSFQGPLVVLVGPLSASASEIFAGALQDYDRALIVGEKTHGKGTVQSVIALKRAARLAGVPDAGRLKLTVSKFYRVSGNTTQRVGVTPDIILPSLIDHSNTGEGSLENSLEASRLAPLDYPRMDRVKPYLASLQRGSAARIKASTDFRYLLEDMARLKENARKAISLNETRRLQEKAREDAAERVRRQERAKRKPTHRRVFELDLEMVEKQSPLRPVDPGKYGFGFLSEAPVEPRAEDDAASPVPDIQLEEALNILGDYAALSGK